jgi:hypothetical protein
MFKKKGDPVTPAQGGRMMPSDPADPAHLPIEELIRRKAYDIYEQRGREHGRALDDWLAAEAQITSRTIQA